MTRGPRGRWAPSPTGWLHLGNARTALVAWLSVRQRGGTLVWRVEDLDPPRVVAGMAEAQQEDLAWLGLDWDEGPDRGGPCAPYLQSQRAAHYEAALDRLCAAERLFPCRRSRRDLEGIASAPHGMAAWSAAEDRAESAGSASRGDAAAAGDPDGEALPAYPAAFRPAHLPADWLERLRRGEEPGDSAGFEGTEVAGDPQVLADPTAPGDARASQGRGAPAALRFRVLAHPVSFVDRVQGPWVERVDRAVGDFVVKRRDGLYAYQLAVVVDDLAMEIDDVVRGADLMASTARQIQLIAGLGGVPPAYAHVPLMVNAAGEKLSKRDSALEVHALRRAGVRPEAIVGYLAHSLGLLERPRPCRAAELVEHFSWGRLAGNARSEGEKASRPWRLPADLAARLDRLQRAG